MIEVATRCTTPCCLHIPMQQRLQLSAWASQRHQAVVFFCTEEPWCVCFHVSGVEPLSINVYMQRNHPSIRVIRDTETTNQLTLSNLESCKGGSRGVENANIENHPGSHVLLTGFFFFTGWETFLFLICLVRIPVVSVVYITSSLNCSTPEKRLCREIYIQPNWFRSTNICLSRTDAASWLILDKINK